MSVERGPGLDPTLAPLRGGGVLAIWNGIDAADEAEFNEWHIRQHLPERVATPGFLRARRYVNRAAGDPRDGTRYFTLYEVEEPGILASEPYLRRLDHPTGWTTRMVARFRNGRRTACRTVHSLGTGAGGVLSTVELTPRTGDGTLPARLDEPWLRALLERHRELVGAHLLEPDEAITGAKASTAEGRADTTGGPAASWVLLLEALSVEGVSGAAAEAAEAAAPALAAPAAVNGYHLQVGLP